MQDFNAIITRDGRVLHLPWATHNDIVEHFQVPENTSLVRQNYWEYDIRVPFEDGGGLQARGIEEPPEAVVEAAEKLTRDLCMWHVGRNLRAVPEDWGDVVEHVYEVRGKRTPKYLNGRGGVYFAGNVDRLSDVRIRRLLGRARIGRLEGGAVVEFMAGSARIDELGGEAVIRDMRKQASIGRMTGRSCVELLCESGVVEKMRDEARVMRMWGASRVLALEGRAAAGRGPDKTVYTADPQVDEEGLLASMEGFERVKVIGEGESVYA